jgi:hypothetical protein
MSQTSTRTARPNPVQMLFHVGKTSRLAGALLRDRRISIFRKIFFIASLALLVLLLILGDAATELVSNILPFVGPVLDIPADATLDWVTLAIVSYNLLRVFPPELVSEHYARLFRAPQTIAPATPTSPHR